MQCVLCAKVDHDLETCCKCGEQVCDECSFTAIRLGSAETICDRCDGGVNALEVWSSKSGRYHSQETIHQQMRRAKPFEFAAEQKSEPPPADFYPQLVQCCERAPRETYRKLFRACTGMIFHNQNPVEHEPHIISAKAIRMGSSGTCRIEFSARCDCDSIDVVPLWEISELPLGAQDDVRHEPEPGSNRLWREGFYVCAEEAKLLQ